MDKEFYKSKAVWLNGLAALVFVACLFGGYADFEPDAEWMALVGAVANSVAIIVRFYTNQAITINGKSISKQQ